MLEGVRKPAWALAASGGKASSTTSPVEGSSSTTTPSAAGAVSLVLSPSELAYIQASRASSLCPPAAPSASLAALTSSLVSYAGGRGSSPGTPSISTPHMTSWVIDSGASSHMTGFPSVLTSYRPETSIPDVRIADGRSCPVLGSGQSRATSSFLYNTSCIFLDSLPICYPSVRSPKPFTVVCFSFLITASSRISTRAGGLDWAVRMDEASTS